MLTGNNRGKRLRQGIIAALWLSCLFMPVAGVNAQGFIVAYSDVEFLVGPGENLSASINVQNVSDEGVTLRVYSGDWVRMTGDVSGYVYKEERDLEVRSLLRWMTFSPDQMELGPHESRDILCEVQIPDDETLEGSYWGVIFVEAVPEMLPDIEEPETGSMSVGINTIFRYAVKIYATFEGTEVRDGSFTRMWIEQAGSDYNVTAVFENPGNIYFRPEAWLEIRNLAGEVIYRQDHVRQTVLPESEREYKFELRNLGIGPGSYLVMVIADYGASELVAAQALMELKEEETETME